MTQRTWGLVSFAASLLGDDPGINEIFFSSKGIIVHGGIEFTCCHSLLLSPVPTLVHLRLHTAPKVP